MTGPLTSQITKTSTLEKFNLAHNLTLTEKVGHFCLDERFDRYTLRHHVPGSIDSFHVYISCDASKIEDPSSLVGNDIKLSGKVGKLDERLKPNTIIAGEEFFVIVSLDNLSPDESSQ